MVELRKRPAAAASPPPPPTKRRASASSVRKSKDTIAKKEKEPLTAPPTDSHAGAAAAKDLALVDTIGLDSEIGRIEVTTDQGESVTLKTLYEKSVCSGGGSSDGIVIFTYPKASTPGCTTQAQLFRDSYDLFTKSNTNTNKTPKNSNKKDDKDNNITSLTIFGLSTDTPKANASFKAKHNLPYTLLCDPPGKLVRALGMGHDGSNPAKKTARRGVVVLVDADHDKNHNHNHNDGDGKEKEKAKVKVAVILKGGPGTTVEAVRTFLSSF